MSRPLAVLRPEPGNAATAARIEGLGHAAIRLPLFVVRPLAWEAPPASGFDALILTSANTLRHAGPQLACYAHLPVHAVGEATAMAARAAGLRVESTGRSDAKALLAQVRDSGVRQALLLGGRDMASGGGLGVAAIRSVYASELVADVEAARLYDVVALVHSPRAAARLHDLIPLRDRARVAVASISRAAADRLGPGWHATAIAPHPTDQAVIVTAIGLAD